MHNPYNYHVAVREDRMFFGREEIIARLVRGLGAPVPLSAAIFGGRRCGKRPNVVAVAVQQGTALAQHPPPHGNYHHADQQRHANRSRNQQCRQFPLAGTCFRRRCRRGSLRRPRHQGTEGKLDAAHAPAC